MTIKQRLETLNSELSHFTGSIVAVTKYSTPEQMVEAYQSGLTNFGESKVQSVEEKWGVLPEDLKKNVTWHFIGHIQTNKVKKIVGHFQLIHSVDTVKLATRINKEAENIHSTQNILLQVNISKEESKAGFYKEDLPGIFPELLELKSINIKGLMTMAPFTTDTHVTRECFSGLKNLKDELEKSFNHKLPELSMGMSNDYKIAIEEGSTLIRIGNMLFA